MLEHSVFSDRNLSTGSELSRVRAASINIYTRSEYIALYVLILTTSCVWNFGWTVNDRVDAQLYELPQTLAFWQDGFDVKRKLRDFVLKLGEKET